MGSSGDHYSKLLVDVLGLLGLTDVTLVASTTLSGSASTRAGTRGRSAGGWEGRPPTLELSLPWPFRPPHCHHSLVPSLAEFDALVDRGAGRSDRDASAAKVTAALDALDLSRP